MPLDMQDSNHVSGSEQGNSSDDVQIVSALRKMKKEIEVMVIHTVHREIGPFVEGLIRKVVKEEIQSAQEKFLTGGNRNDGDEIMMSRESNLQLKFLDDEVSEPVLTGKEIKGKGGTPMTLALVDNITEQVVDCGPGSSAKVEIVVLESSGDDDEDSLEDFNNMIIQEGDKKKPHFTKSNYMHLMKGIGNVYNSKLGHGSNWIKNCKCRLGARIVENLGGVRVQEAWTKSFTVSDSRGKLYGNCSVPSLLDDIWRLKNIARDGAPCKRLKENKISTVKDFLFLHSVDPQRLQQIAAGPKCKAPVAAGAKWKTTVDHALTCIIDDNTICLYYPPSESKTGVTFDVVGGLKGVIQDSHYVPLHDLSETQKACAHKLIRSAYENEKDISYFEDETSLLSQFPYRSSEVNGCDLATSETMNGYDPMSQPGTSSQSTSIIRHVSSLGSITTEQVNDPNLGVPYQDPSCWFHDLEADSSSRELVNMGRLYSPDWRFLPNCSFVDFDPHLEHFGDNQNQMSPVFPESNNNVPHAIEAESPSHQQSNGNGNGNGNGGGINLVEIVDALLWIVRAKKKFMALGNTHVQKKHRMH